MAPPLLCPALNQAAYSYICSDFHIFSLQASQAIQITLIMWLKADDRSPAVTNYSIIPSARTDST